MNNKVKNFLEENKVPYHYRDYVKPYYEVYSVPNVHEFLFSVLENDMEFNRTVSFVDGKKIVVMVLKEANLAPSFNLIVNWNNIPSSAKFYYSMGSVLQTVYENPNEKLFEELGWIFSWQTKKS